MARRIRAAEAPYNRVRESPDRLDFIGDLLQSHALDRQRDCALAPSKLL